jgi:hypothetical protein
VVAIARPTTQAFGHCQLFLRRTYPLHRD